MARHLRRPFFRTPCEVDIDNKTYKIKNKIDNGSFGQVYVGHPINESDNLVAIKIVST